MGKPGRNSHLVHAVHASAATPLSDSGPCKHLRLLLLAGGFRCGVSGLPGRGTHRIGNDADHGLGAVLGAGSRQGGHNGGVGVEQVIPGHA